MAKKRVTKKQEKQQATLASEVIRHVVHGQVTTPSVKLSRNAKGDVQIEVSVYADSAEEASKQAQDVFDALCKKYKKVIG